MKHKIVIIDSDKRSRKLIAGILDEDYDVTSSSGVSEGYSSVTSVNPDVIIIDPDFPKKDGIDFIKSVREWNECPIIAVSENSGEQAVTTAFKVGVDDYIRKPFFSSELCLRVKKQIETVKKIEAARGINTLVCYKKGGLMIEFDARRVILDGELIHLTRNEYKILALLCRFSGKVLTYDYIMKSVWGPKPDNGTGILRVNIANIRRKIEKDPETPVYLMTENGVGYRVCENEET